MDASLKTYFCSESLGFTHSENENHAESAVRQTSLWSTNSMFNMLLRSLKYSAKNGSFLAVGPFSFIMPLTISWALAMALEGLRHNLILLKWPIAFR